MRVAVTGATGFVGRSVASRLVEDGHEVVALSRSLGAELPAGVELVHGDLVEPRSLGTFARGADLVIHAAGLVRSSDIVALRRVNVEGTAALAREVPPEVRFVHLSTAGIYGSPAARVDERSPWLPKNAYERSKAEGERRLRDLRPDVRVLRPTNVLGVGHPLDALVRFMNRVANDRVLGAEQAAVNYVGVDTVAAAVVAAGTDPDARAEVIVNEPMRLREFVGLVSGALGVPARFRPIPARLSEIAVRALPAGTRVQRVGRMRALVDPTWIATVHDSWLETHGLASGLDRTLAAMAADYRERGRL